MTVNDTTQKAMETVLGFPLGPLFEKLKLTIADTFCIKGAGRLLVASINRSAGHTETIRLIMNATSEDFTPFDPRTLSTKDRNQLVHELATTLRTKNADIADILDISQSQVYIILQQRLE